MKTCLLDVNVLLALAWPHHAHHDTVHQWWLSAGVTSWATTTQTQLGFVRVSCHPKFVPTPASPAQALRLLLQMTSRSDHAFWAEAPDGTRDAEVAPTLCLSHPRPDHRRVPCRNGPSPGRPTGNVGSIPGRATPGCRTARLIAAGHGHSVGRGHQPCAEAGPQHLEEREQKASRLSLANCFQRRSSLVLYRFQRDRVALRPGRSGPRALRGSVPPGSCRGRCRQRGGEPRHRNSAHRICRIRQSARLPG